MSLLNSAEPTQSVRPPCEDANMQQQPTALKYSTSRVQNVRMPTHHLCWKHLWPFKPVPILWKTSNQKLWLFNPLSFPSCHPGTFVARLFQEVKSLIWDGDCATGFPCAPEFQRLPGRQLGVRGHGNPPAKGFMGKSKAWQQLCFPLLTEGTEACEIFVG